MSSSETFDIGIDDIEQYSSLLVGLLKTNTEISHQSSRRWLESYIPTLVPALEQYRTTKLRWARAMWNLSLIQDYTDDTPIVPEVVGADDPSVSEVDGEENPELSEMVEEEGPEVSGVVEGKAPEVTMDSPVTNKSLDEYNDARKDLDMFEGKSPESLTADQETYFDLIDLNSAMYQWTINLIDSHRERKEAVDEATVRSLQDVFLLHWQCLTYSESERKLDLDFSEAPPSRESQELQAKVQGMRQRVASQWLLSTAGISK